MWVEDAREAIRFAADLSVMLSKRFGPSLESAFPNA
jgi:hypothetical protein